MSKATGYSLWLVPDIDTEIYRTLAKFIAEIAGKHRTLLFEPHVTLLGGIDGSEQDMRNKTGRLANALAPYEIRLGEIGSNGIYFQILFSKVEQTEAVLRANHLAQKVFEVDQGKYFPHCSLAYGSFSQKVLTVLKQKFGEQLNSPIVRIKFIVREIELWHTEGTVEEWYRVATFPMGKSRDSLIN